jgi:hypothetical protein
MTSRISKRFGTFSRMAAAVLAGVLVLGAGLKATAQDADASTLRGTWRVQVTTYDCTTGQQFPTFSAMFSFHPGGTLGGTTSTTAFQPGQLTAHVGSWSHIRDNKYQAASEAFILFTSNPGPGPVFQQGRQRIAQVITLHGDQYTSVASAQFFDVSGNLLFTGCATEAGQRFH